MQKADVLLVTATEAEARAVLSLFPEPHLCHLGEQSYHDLGDIKGARVFMVQSEMGSGGPSGATLTIEEGLRLLNPSAVIMVGIAFGIAESKQRMGDILVSKQLIQYELQRIGTSGNYGREIYLRDDRPSASPLMLQRFRAATNYWQTPPKVEFGSILSGAKLIDDQDFRDQLLRFAPEVIGGEMEGSGLYAVAHRKKVNWIVVKAICDWADGDKHRDKEERQQRAAENAARFTLYVLEQGGFAKPEQEMHKTPPDDVINFERHQFNGVQALPLRPIRQWRKLMIRVLVAVVALLAGSIGALAWYHAMPLALNMTATGALDAYCSAQLAGYWDNKGQWNSEAGKYIAATRFDNNNGVEYSPSPPWKMSTYKDCHREIVNNRDRVMCEVDREIYVVDKTYNDGSNIVAPYRREVFVQKVRSGWLLTLEITISSDELPGASNNHFPTEGDCGNSNRVPDNTPAAA